MLVHIIFGFLRPDLSPQGDRNRYFLAALCLLIVRRPNLEVATDSNQKYSPLADKNIGVFLALSCGWKFVFTALFIICGYTHGSWMPFVTTDEFS